MNNGQLLIALIVVAVGIPVSIIGFFLKRTITKVDENTNEIAEIKSNYVKKEELNAIREDLRELSKNIDDIKDNYIKKDDFVRSVAETNNRLERIYNFLLDMNGGRRNG